MVVDMTPENISFCWAIAGQLSGFLVWLVISRLF